MEILHNGPCRKICWRIFRFRKRLHFEFYNRITGKEIYFLHRSEIIKFLLRHRKISTLSLMELIFIRIPSEIEKKMRRRKQNKRLE